MMPLRGGKFDLNEGGIRVPAFVRWPSKIKANAVTDQVAITMDWTVTILNAAQINTDSFSFDGINLLPVLEGQEENIERNLFWRLTNRARWNAYRSADWKYLKTPDGESLYNLSNDISESNDLKSSEPAIFQRLKSEFENLDKEMLPPYVFPKK